MDRRMSIGTAAAAAAALLVGKADGVCRRHLALRPVQGQIGQSAALMYPRSTLPRT
jgi:hypothetical protein